MASLSLDNLRRQLFEPMGSSEFSDFLKLGISTASAATRETTGKPREAFAEAKTVKGKPYVMVLDTRLFAGIDCLEQALPRAHYVAKHQADWEAGFAEINAKIARLEEQING